MRDGGEGEHMVLATVSSGERRKSKEDKRCACVERRSEVNMRGAMLYHIVSCLREIMNHDLNIFKINQRH